MANGMLDYFRMRNVFGDQANFGNNVTGQYNFAQEPRPQTILPSRNTVPFADMPPESIDVFPEEGTALGALKRNVMNPPHVPFEYPKSTLNGLTEALKIAAEPSAASKNRVMVDGKPYQKQTKFKDAEGNEHIVNPVQEPSFMQQVLRAMPASVSAGTDILNSQAQRPIAEWEMQNKALGSAANIEKSEETNRALAAQRYAQAGVIPAREDRLAREGDTKLKQGQDRINIERAKQNLNEWKAKNPNGKIYAPKGGNVVVINPQTGEAIDTGIETGSMTDKELQELKGKQAVEQIGARGKEARETEGVKHEDELEEIEARGGEARKTKSVEPGGAGSTSRLPSQQKVQQQLKANQLIRDHPEWSKWISTDPNTGMVNIAPPSTGGYFSRGPSKEIYDQINQALGGASAPVSSTEEPSDSNMFVGPKQPKPAPAGKVEPGYVKIADASGKIVAQIPKGDAARLNKAKYHVVQ